MNIKHFIIFLLRYVLKIIYFFPIKENRMICVAYHGESYTCSPKYITEYIIEHSIDYEIIWALNNPILLRNEIPKTIKLVKYRSFKYIYYTLTAKIRINNAEEWIILPRRPGQLVINTWHGGGVYKKCAKKAKLINKRLGNNDYYNISNLFLSASAAMSKYVCRESFNYKGKILNCGLPRNDMLINIDSNKEKANIIRKKLDIKEDEKLLLYAPTFRELNDKDFLKLDFLLLIKNLKEKFGGNWKVLVRTHMVTTNGMGFAKFFKDRIDYIDVSKYNDVQELLLISDILITDYSSLMWDFSLSNKPCFLYVPDLDEYIKEERGFYIDIDKWGFSYAKTNEELGKIIKLFNREDYIRNIKNYYKLVGIFESGKATEYVIDYIRSWK